MNLLNEIYRTSLILLTDLYQLTMAYSLWKNKATQKEAVFHAYFRKTPFNSGYAISCGLSTIIDYLQNFRFEESDLAYLQELEGNDGSPLFESGFIDYLRTMEFDCDIDAIPEGTPVFPNQPLLRVKGPLLQCMILETAILNIINFQTLIATKAARIKEAAKDDLVLEFGLRRAQGIDGSISASKAAYIGGCDATSNVLAGKLFGIPVKGTHAHSWVMAHDNETEAFEAYAQAQPNNCTLLVDTYDTIEGVKHAIKIGLDLKQKGHRLAGIRLDSGDLAFLSIEARKLLDEAGLTDTTIVASNDLDEYLISSLKNEQDAAITVWGVGTRLATAHDQPALGGVYKLGCIRSSPTQEWLPKIKLSEQMIKVSIPGMQQVRRYTYDDGQYMADMIYNELQPLSKSSCIIDPNNAFRNKKISEETPYEDLLHPIFRNGKLVYQSPSIQESRERTKQELQKLHKGIKRLSNPHSYPVGLEENLHHLRVELIKVEGI
ncbi:nicotinate phosphoribosyltransferase [Algivirga pacifica]|uniref:Nicotinate phosphoribosyltransferase n=1 Tax=Algivirga pacifica TaxID=1162670 RepID=A0ABP9D487_9BACT